MWWPRLKKVTCRRVHRAAVLTIIMQTYPDGCLPCYEFAVFPKICPRYCGVQKSGSPWQLQWFWQWIQRQLPGRRTSREHRGRSKSTYIEGRITHIYRQRSSWRLFDIHLDFPFWQSFNQAFDRVGAFCKSFSGEWWELHAHVIQRMRVILVFLVQCLNNDIHSV
jgi:hypothetical protein